MDSPNATTSSGPSPATAATTPPTTSAITATAGATTASVATTTTGATSPTPTPATTSTNAVPAEREFYYTVGCTNDDPKRLKVLEELMATEQHYIKDLSVLIRSYIIPLRNSQILTENDVSTLCFNIEAIEALHQEIFGTLSSIIETYKADPQRSLSYYIADYFMGLSDKLKLYSTYSSETPDRISKDPLFVMFLERMRAGTGSKLHLDDYLIKPIQRICKYPLLFRELERNTPPNDEELIFFQEAVKTLESVVQLVNDTRKQFEAVKRVIEIESMLTELPEPIVASGRVLVKEGPLQKQSPREGSFRQDRYCFLFKGPVRQDILIYTKMKNKKSYIFRGKIDLSNSYMKDLPALGFQLSQPNSVKSYTFFCKSQVEKQTWMAELAGMVMQPPPSAVATGTSPATTGTNKGGFSATGSFIKSAAFQTSRPPGSPNSGPVKFGRNRLVQSASSSYIDASGATAGSTPDGASTASEDANGASAGSRLNKLKVSNDSANDSSDELSASPSNTSDTPTSPHSASPNIAIPARVNAPPSSSSTTSPTSSRAPAVGRAASSLAFSPPSSSHAANPTTYHSSDADAHKHAPIRSASSFIRGISTYTPSVVATSSDKDKEIHRLQGVISGLEAKLQEEANLRAKLEKEVETLKQKLYYYESSSTPAANPISPRQTPSNLSENTEQQQLQQQQLLLQQQQQQLIQQQQFLLQQQQQLQQKHNQPQPTSKQLTPESDQHPQQESPAKREDAPKPREPQQHQETTSEPPKTTPSRVPEPNGKLPSTQELSASPLFLEDQMSSLASLQAYLNSVPKETKPEPVAEPPPQSQPEQDTTDTTPPTDTPSATTTSSEPHPTTIQRQWSAPRLQPQPPHQNTPTSPQASPHSQSQPSPSYQSTPQVPPLLSPRSPPQSPSSTPLSSSVQQEQEKLEPEEQTEPLDPPVSEPAEPTTEPSPTTTLAAPPPPQQLHVAEPSEPEHDPPQEQEQEQPTEKHEQQSEPEQSEPESQSPSSPRSLTSSSSEPQSSESMGTSPSQQGTEPPLSPRNANSSSSDTPPTSLRASFEANNGTSSSYPEFAENYVWIKEGSMTKMGDVRQNWKERWFRLAPGYLFYFKSPKDAPKKQLGVVDLTSTPEFSITVTRSTKKPVGCFAVNTPSREWFFTATSEKEANEWIQAISSAIIGGGGGGSTSSGSGSVNAAAAAGGVPPTTN